MGVNFHPRLLLFAYFFANFRFLCFYSTYIWFNFLTFHYLVSTTTTRARSWRSSAATSTTKLSTTCSLRSLSTPFLFPFFSFYLSYYKNKLSIKEILARIIKRRK